MKKSNKRGLSTLILSGIIAISTGSGVYALKEPTLIEGSDRIRTSIKTATYQNKQVETLILANGFSFADSLSSVNLYNKYPNSKLILVSNKVDLIKEVENIKPKQILIIGGEKTINQEFIKKLENLNIPIHKFAGKDRYETNEKTLEGFTQVGIADGRNYPDALASSPLLRKENLGLKLVNGAKSYYTDKKVVYTFGDKGSVIQNGGLRLAGKSRYETNEEINKKLKDQKTNLITYGGNFADALSSINLLESNPRVILLNNKTISNFNKELIKNNENILIGGLIKKSLPDVQRISLNKSSEPTKQEEKIKSIENIKPIENTTKKQEDVKIYRDDNGYTVELDYNRKPNSDNNKVQTTTNKNLPTFKEPSVINTQKDLDRYVLSRFVNGISENGESVDVKNSDITDISPALDYIIEDTGFKIKGHKEGSKYNFTLTPSFLLDDYIGGNYNRGDFISNLNHIREDIKKSGALTKNNRYDKYQTFSVYVKKVYPYKSVASKNFREETSTPYSLYWNNYASCLGYTFYNNLAAMLMQIPSYAVVGDYGKPNYYHAENRFLAEDGTRHHFNTTGVTPFYDDIPDSILIETLKPTLKNYYYSYNNGQRKDYDYLPKRENSIRADFYN